MEMCSARRVTERPMLSIPSSEANDNFQSTMLQGYHGKIVECSACHSTVPVTRDGGPHGLHTIGQEWVNRHGDYAEHNLSSCAVCHGTDYMGTVLSRTSTARTFNAEDLGTISFPQGHVVACYDCHEVGTLN